MPTEKTKPMSFAEQLKCTADSKHEGKVTKEVQSIVTALLAKAEKAAKEGSYSADLYDERLGSPDVDNAVKNLLRQEGFKEVQIEEDHNYTQHVGKSIMFVRVTWK